jgi:hypothetical protein
MIRSARDNAQLAETAREGASILGPDTPAAARLDNIARALDFVGESLTGSRDPLLESATDLRRHRQAELRSGSQYRLTSTTSRPSSLVAQGIEHRFPNFL